MTERNEPPPTQAIQTTLAVGVIVLTTTVSSVVWWHISLWLWSWSARQGWWGPPADGAKVAAAGIALLVTWVIWGRVTYWLTMPDADRPNPR